MKISTKGRYALRLMADIGAHDQSAGFLSSERGAQGGSRLSRAPEEYTVGSILRLTEGDLAPVACLEGPENRCRRCGECTTLDFWTGLYDVVRTYLDSHTLADLMDSEHSQEP